MNEYRYLYRTDFLSFTKFAFRILHPGETIDETSWHVSFLCNIVDFSWRAKDPAALRRLIFNLPPGCLKTHIFSVCLPAWILGRDPRQRVLIVSETTGAARDIQSRCRELMESSRYRAIFPKTIIKKDGRELELTHGGGIRHSGMGRSFPYRWSDLVVIDNPESPHTRDGHHHDSLRNSDMLLRHPKQGLAILATRRLGTNDLSNFLYLNSGWAVFPIPAVGVKETKWVFPPFDDHMQRRGEPLTGRLRWDELEALHNDLGAEAFAYQYLQGEYVPTFPFTGNVGMTKDGRIAFFRRSPDLLASIAAEHLKGLREEHEEWLEKIHEIIRTHPVSLALPGKSG